MLNIVCGRLAQVDRALVSGTKGRAFESHIAHHNKINRLRLFLLSKIFLQKIRAPHYAPQTKWIFKTKNPPKRVEEGFVMTDVVIPILSMPCRCAFATPEPVGRQYSITSRL